MIWTPDNIGNATEYQQTQIDYVRAHALFMLRDAAAAINAARILGYLAAFKDYKESRDNRPDLEPRQTPEPPTAMIIVEDEYGNPVEDDSDIPVCPPLVYIAPKRPDLKEGLIGKRLYPGNDTYFDILRGDVTPNMKRVKGKSADVPPVEGEFEKHAYLQSSPGAHEIPGVWIRI